jgi:hypothetical protein
MRCRRTRTDTSGDHLIRLGYLPPTVYQTLPASHPLHSRTSGIRPGENPAKGQFVTDSETDSITDTRSKYVVIGAGPSGLAAAKNLRQQGLLCEVLEGHSALGGIWNRSNPRSSVYSPTHTITSKTVTAYIDFPLADELAPYPRHDQIHSYLESFAAAHELTDIIRFDQEVALAPDEEG